MKITEVTRRNIIDALVSEEVDWSGRLNEPDFLARVFDLGQLPSSDPRFSTMAHDIWQHRINNYDWPTEWVYSDERLDLLHCPDEIFLTFLCEMIHPVVRAESTEVGRLCQMFNTFLFEDGYEIVSRTSISGRPVFAARQTDVRPTDLHLEELKTSEELRGDYVSKQINRMESALQANDPDVAIGTAKELVETCCKTILRERGETVPTDADLIRLVKTTAKILAISPQQIPNSSRARDSILQVLGSLGSITQGLAELRNVYGTGHGRDSTSQGLTVRHAKLAVGAASTLALFLVETHRFRG